MSGNHAVSKLPSSIACDDLLSISGTDEAPAELSAPFTSICEELLIITRGCPEAAAAVSLAGTKMWTWLGLLFSSALIVNFSKIIKQLKTSKTNRNKKFRDIWFTGYENSVIMQQTGKEQTPRKERVSPAKLKGVKGKVRIRSIH